MTQWERRMQGRAENDKVECPFIIACLECWWSQESLLCQLCNSLMYRNVHNYMHTQFKCHEVSHKSKCKPPVCNFGVSICIQVIFRLGLGFLMSLQGLYLGGHFMTFILCISHQKWWCRLQEERWAHFVTATKNGMHISTYMHPWTYQNSDKPVSPQAAKEMHLTWNYTTTNWTYIMWMARDKIQSLIN